MTPLSEQDIERVAVRLAEIAEGEGIWDCLAELQKDRYRKIARALAPALGVPEQKDFTLTHVIVDGKEWSYHVAAVRQIVGEP